MAHGLPALGIALVTLAGSVWYVPALADLRAGADRPLSRRSAAAACLTGWGTCAAVAVLLLAGAVWQAVGAAAVAGAAGAVVLRLRAAAQERCEGRETARHWAALRAVPARPDHSRHAVATLLLGGAATVLIAATAVLLGGPGGATALLMAVVPLAVVGLLLAVAVNHARAARRS